jgi:hypothetical protein
MAVALPEYAPLPPPEGLGDWAEAGSARQAALSSAATRAARGRRTDDDRDMWGNSSGGVGTGAPFNRR